MALIGISEAVFVIIRPMRTVPMRLADLLQDVPGATLVQGDPRADVRGVVHDSRRVEPGHLFVVMPGERYDARRYVPQALSRGAVGIVSDQPLDVAPDRAV